MNTKIIYKLMMLLTVALFVACSEDEGTDVGSDSSPKVTIYQYAVEAPYNPDNDTRLRLAVNNKVESLYYLAELTAEKDARIKSLGESGYNDYVIKNGTKVEIPNGEMNADVIITGMLGEYTITAVAVNGGTNTSAAVTFTGIDWVKVKAATAKMNPFTGESVETELQYASLIGKYRVVDPWGTGVGIVFTWDGSSEHVTFDSSKIATGWQHPSYGEVTFHPSSGGSFYSASADAFLFTGEWTVSAGSFGEVDGAVYLHD